jgi:anti-sigma factor RsiW
MSGDHTQQTKDLLAGALTGRAADDAAEHIEICQACQVIVAEAEPLPLKPTQHAAPAALRIRVTEMLDAEARTVVPLRRKRPGFWLGAASGAVGTALAAALVFFAIVPPTVETFADSVIDTHVAALMNGHEIGVISTNHHTVKPWFAGKIALSPPVADFADAGFKLAGGRMDHIGDIQAAVVVYRHGAHAVDLFVWADRGQRLPGAQVRRGYHATFWKKNDLDFAAVSDTEDAELQKFVGLVKGERE